jgi:hypothetical protein
MSTKDLCSLRLLFSVSNHISRLNSEEYGKRKESADMQSFEKCLGKGVFGVSSFHLLWKTITSKFTSSSQFVMLSGQTFRNM